MSLEGSCGRGVCRKATSARLESETPVEAAALKRYVGKLLFEACCFECTRMAAIPQGAFTVLQVRKNVSRYNAAKYEEEEDKKEKKSGGYNAKVLQEGRELTPLKYNSKLMNSIWGLYNRYSVHNFKKIDANERSLLEEAWGSLAVPAASAVASAAEGRPVIGTAGGAAGH